MGLHASEPLTFTAADLENIPSLDKWVVGAMANTYVRHRHEQITRQFADCYF